MKTIKIANVLLLGTLLALATGCGKSKALMAAEAYETAACACKDAKCATEATTKYTQSAGDMATAKGGEAEAITKASSAAANCVMKASMAGLPTAPK